MNSVLQIGEKIIFLKNGIKEWEGDKDQILETRNKSIVEFVYSSDLFKKVRESLLADEEDHKDHNKK
jgi:phospholipid/cholesterol/gamma-HCH transport system ATP-binding protein